MLEVEVFGFVRCYFISALVLASFRLTKDRATFFRLKIIAASLLHLMVLLFSKVIVNYSSKHQFVVLHCRNVFILNLFEDCMK